MVFCRTGMASTRSFRKILPRILDCKTNSNKAEGKWNQGLTKTYKKLLYSTHNTAILARFAQFLTYKAIKVGKRVIRIDESYMFQQRCRCGKRMKRALSEYINFNDCGNRIDRDLNSTINILEYLVNQMQYFDFLSHQSSITEEFFHEGLDLLRNTVPSP